MTATPRIFGDESKKKATIKDAVIASMDDEDVYGPELHRLGFGEAVEKDLLADYRVLILTVDEKYVSGNFQTELAEDGEIQLSDAAKIIGCWNGLAKHFDAVPGESLTPMQRAVAFAPDIATSKAIAAAFPSIVDRHVESLDVEDDAESVVRSHELQVQCDHVDGTFNALERNERLDWLKADDPEGVCRVLTNARCLSEGVDVPALDAVMFLTPRGSEVDVVQSVRRVMRKAPGKDYGYIILPVAVPAGSSPDQALADNKRYAVVWQVLNALRSHDDRFDATVNKIDLNKKKTTARIGFGGINADGELSTGPDSEQGGLDLSWGDGWRNAIYARIVDKVGNRKYWATWAGDVAQIAQQVTERIQGILSDQTSHVATEFDRFLGGLRGNLNEGISAEDAIEMLAQHLITRPIFQALFGTYDGLALNADLATADFWTADDIHARTTALAARVIERFCRSHERGSIQKLAARRDQPLVPRKTQLSGRQPGR